MESAGTKIPGMAKRIAAELLLPVAAGALILLLGEHLYSARNDFLTVIRLILADAVIAGAVIGISRGFRGCGLLMMLVCGALMGTSAVVLLTHRNVMVSSTSFYIVGSHWAGILATSLLARLFDRRGRLKGFAGYFKAVSIVFFIFYTAMLLYALFFKLYSPGGYSIRYRAVNWIPFATIWPYLTDTARVSVRVERINLIANLLLFLPFGFYLEAVLYRRRRLLKLVLLAAVPLLAELLQYVFAVGSSDIDDVILGMLGGLIGLLLYRALEGLFALLHGPGKRITGKV